jgi:hypothetical protein
MFAKHLIDKVLITLEVGDKTPLFILLGKDGTIHRKGNGDSTSELPLMMGHSRDGHFDAIMMTVQEDIFNYTGVIKMPERLGTECRLTIIFQAGDTIDYSFRIVYGERSQGPPVELAQILINAVKLTEPWYTEQQQKEAENQKNKSFWKGFWK